VAYRLSCSICLSRSDIAIALVYDAVFARFFWTRGTDRMLLRGKCSKMQLRHELVLHDTMATDNRPPATKNDRLNPGTVGFAPQSHTTETAPSLLVKSLK
jgi:hypothetical protein